MYRARAPRLWVGCVAGWLALALVEGTALHFDAVRAGRASQLAAVLAERALADVVWLAVAAVVFRYVERAAAQTAGTVRLALLGLALAPLYLTWGSVAYAAMHGQLSAGLWAALSEIPATTLIWDVVLCSLLALTARMLAMARRDRRLERAGVEMEARLARAELSLLRGQLEPHFLFNALNTIAALIRSSSPEAATAALAKLSELLRYVVAASTQDRVPLAWEIDFATSYLELQRLRFGPRMQFAIRVSSIGRGCDVPPLLLQPLIENAVVHGVARTREAVAIELAVAVAGGELRIEIANTCDDQAAGDRGSTGVGLRNTRQRLERIYGADFALAAGPAGPGRYEVTIALPYREATA